MKESCRIEFFRSLLTKSFLVTERIDCPMTCSEHAYCKRNGSSFDCDCTRGYIGDGKECIGKLVISKLD